MAVAAIVVEEGDEWQNTADMLTDYLAIPSTAVFLMFDDPSICINLTKVEGGR